MKKIDYNIVSVVAIVIVLILAILISNPPFIKSQYLAAEVNGEQILMSEINSQYDALPDEFKDTITKETILQNMIDLILLKQEAEARGIILTDGQFNSLLDQALEQANVTKDELKKKLSDQGMTLNYLKTQYISDTLLKEVLEGVDDEEKQEFVQQFVKNLRSKANITIYMK